MAKSQVTKSTPLLGRPCTGTETSSRTPREQLGKPSPGATRGRGHGARPAPSSGTAPSGHRACSYLGRGRAHLRRGGRGGRSGAEGWCLQVTWGEEPEAGMRVWPGVRPHLALRPALGRRSRPCAPGFPPALLARPRPRRPRSSGWSSSPDGTLGPEILPSSAPLPTAPHPPPAPRTHPRSPCPPRSPAPSLTLWSPGPPPASSPTAPAYPQRAPPGRAGDRRCRRCFGSVAAGTRGAAAPGAAGRPPGRSSSGPVGSPAWRGLLGKKPRGVGGWGERTAQGARRRPTLHGRPKRPGCCDPTSRQFTPHPWFPVPPAALRKLPGSSGGGGMGVERE